MATKKSKSKLSTGEKVLIGILILAVLIGIGYGFFIGLNPDVCVPLKEALVGC